MRYLLSTAVLLTTACSVAAAPLTAEHLEVPIVVTVHADNQPSLPLLPPLALPESGRGKSSRKAPKPVPQAPAPEVKGLELEFSVKLPEPAPAVLATPPALPAPVAPKQPEVVGAKVVVPTPATAPVPVAAKPVAPPAPRSMGTDTLTAELVQQKLGQKLTSTLAAPIIERAALQTVFAAATPLLITPTTSEAPVSLVSDLHRARLMDFTKPVLDTPLLSAADLAASIRQAQASEPVIATASPAVPAPTFVERSADIYLPMECAKFEPTAETVEVEYQVRKGGAVERKVTERPARLLTEFEIKAGDSLRKTLSAWAVPGHMVFWEATPKDADFVFKAPAHFGKDRQAALTRLMGLVSRVAPLTLNLFENNVSAVRGSIPAALCGNSYK